MITQILIDRSGGADDVPAISGAIDPLEGEGLLVGQLVQAVAITERSVDI